MSHRHPKSLYFLVPKGKNIGEYFTITSSKAEADATIEANEWSNVVEVIKYIQET